MVQGNAFVETKAVHCFQHRCIGRKRKLYMLIIFASLFSASVSLLIILISIFGWLGIAAYIRAEFLKNRTLDYVRAGVS